jgi:hypothetical protein
MTYEAVKTTPELMEEAVNTTPELAEDATLATATLVTLRSRNELSARTHEGKERKSSDLRGLKRDRCTQNRGDTRPDSC